MNKRYEERYNPDNAQIFINISSMADIPGEGLSVAIQKEFRDNMHIESLAYRKRPYEYRARLNMLYTEPADNQRTFSRDDLGKSCILKTDAVIVRETISGAISVTGPEVYTITALTFSETDNTTVLWVQLTDSNYKVSSVKPQLIGTGYDEIGGIVPVNGKFAFVINPVCRREIIKMYFEAKQGHDTEVINKKVDLENLRKMSLGKLLTDETGALISRLFGNLVRINSRAQREIVETQFWDRVESFLNGKEPGKITELIPGKVVVVIKGRAFDHPKFYYVGNSRITANLERADTYGSPEIYALNIDPETLEIKKDPYDRIESLGNRLGFVIEETEFINSLEQGTFPRIRNDRHVFEEIFIGALKGLEV